MLLTTAIAYYIYRKYAAISTVFTFIIFFLLSTNLQIGIETVWWRLAVEIEKNLTLENMCSYIQ